MADTSLIFNIVARDQASQKFDKIKAKAALLGVAVAAMGAKFGGDAIRNASDLNETLSKTRVLFGKATPDVEKFASTAATSLGQSKQQALDAAATFATFGKSAGLGGRDLVGFSTNLTKLASDMASFSNTSPEDAITAISAALRGESEPIRRYGVLLDDASLRQEALKQGLIETTKQALTPQQKVLAAQALIFKQTTAAQGDFGRTSDGLANKQRILKARYEDISATIGMKLLPAVTGLAGGVLSLINFTQKYGDVVVPVVAILGTAVAVIWGINKATKAWAATQAAWNVVMAANPIGLVIVAIALLAAGLVIAYKKSETFRNVVNGAFGAVVAAGQAMWGALKAAFKFIVDAWFTLTGAIIHGAAKAFGWVPGIGPKLKKAASEFDAFRDSVNASLSGIQRTIPISFVAIGTSAPNSRFAGKQLPIDGKVPASKDSQNLQRIADAASRRNRADPLTAGWSGS